MESLTARQKENHEISVILGTSDRMMDKENNSLRRSIELGKMNNTVKGTCNNPRCNHVNDLTKNKSVYCTECGMLITNRYY